MTTPDMVLQTATEAGDVPFVVAMTANAEGVTWSGAAGQAAPGRAAESSTVFRMYSMTKAIGSLTAMLLIDRGQLSMKTPVAEILPDWDKLQVLDGWDGDKPRLRHPNTTATIRHLATHMSGLEYEAWCEDTRKYFAITELAAAHTGQKAGLQNHPLMSDPGTRWGYGTGIDWLGQVVEAVDGRRIDAFCQDEVFDPLGMSDTRFEPDGLTDRLAVVHQRGKDGTFGPVDWAPPAQPEFYGMGHALYSTAPDYLRFLRMLLNRGALDGHRLLSEAGVDAMLADQMQGQTFRKMFTTSRKVSADVDLAPDSTHSFASVRTETDQPGKRRAGSQSWAGICNTHFWLDPASDLAAVLMTQSLPFVEPPFMRTYDAFERAVYAGL